MNTSRILFGTFILMVIVFVAVNLMFTPPERPAAVAKPAAPPAPTLISSEIKGPPSVTIKSSDPRSKAFVESLRKAKRIGGVPSGQLAELSKQRTEPLGIPEKSETTDRIIRSMAAELEKAQLTEDEAKGLFAKLNECVTNKQGPLVATQRVICVINAQQLADKFPLLRGEYDKVVRLAPPDTVAAAQKLMIR